MRKLRRGLLIFCILLFGSTSFILGWLVVRHLLSIPNQEPKADPLQLRPYTFDADIDMGRVDPLAIPFGGQAIFWSIKQVAQQKLNGISREKSQLKFRKFIRTSNGISRDKVLELLSAIEVASSLKEKKELEARLANLISSAKAEVSYGSYIGRINQ